MNSASADVVIVGAGLAGCSAAIQFGRRGHSVILIEKSPSPDGFKRLCGHYIQASALPSFNRLQLTREIERLGAVRNGVDLWTSWGFIESPEALADRPYGLNVRRSVLDPLMRSTAAGTANVRFLSGWAAIDLTVDAEDEPRIVCRETSGQGVEISFRLLVGADGRNSTVAKLAEMKERRTENERFCFGSYFSGVKFAEAPRGRMWMLDPDIAIASPQADGSALLVAFPHKRRLDEFRDDRASALVGFFRSLPQGPDLTDADRIDDVLGYVDYPLIERMPVRADLPVALVGDAAASTDPAMGIGCGWAFESADWLVDALSPSLAGERTMRRGLSAYRRTRSRKLATHLISLRVGAKGKRANAVERLAFRASSADPKLADLTTRLGQRLVAPTRLLYPDALLRIGRSAVRSDDRRGPRRDMTT